MDSMTTDEIAAEYELIRSKEAGPAGFTYEECEAHYAYTLPQNALRFSSLGELRAAVVESGSHYFDADAIRFFRAKTHKASNGRDLWSGRFWVESRQFVGSDGIADPREYMVAWVSRYPETGALSVEKLGSFGDLPAARGWAKRLAEAVEAAEESD